MDNFILLDSKELFNETIIDSFNRKEGAYYLSTFFLKESVNAFLEGTYYGTTSGGEGQVVLLQNFEDAKAYFEEKRIKWEV